MKKGVKTYILLSTAAAGQGSKLDRICTRSNIIYEDSNMSKVVTKNQSRQEKKTL